MSFDKSREKVRAAGRLGLLRNLVWRGGERRREVLWSSLEEFLQLLLKNSVEECC